MRNEYIHENGNPTWTNAVGSSDNTAVAIVLAAIADEFHAVDYLSWSYDLNPTGGSLTIAIADDTGADWTIDITTAGPGFFDLKETPFYNRIKNKAVTITLAAAGVGVSGKLNIRHK